MLVLDGGGVTHASYLAGRLETKEKRSYGLCAVNRFQIPPLVIHILLSPYIINPPVTATRFLRLCVYFPVTGLLAALATPACWPGHLSQELSA